MSATTARPTPYRDAARPTPYRDAFRHLFRTRSRRIAAVLLVLALFVVAAAAAVLLLGRAGITGGTVEAGQFAAAWRTPDSKDDTVATVRTSSSETRTDVPGAGTPLPGTLTNSAKMYPTAAIPETFAPTLYDGEAVIFDATGNTRGVIIPNDISALRGYVSGIEADLPTGWTATLVEGCGADVYPSSSNSQTNGGADVVVEISRDANAADLDLAEADIAVLVTGLRDGETAPSSVACEPVVGGAA